VSDPGREATSGRSKDSRLDRSPPRKRARLESPQRCGSSGGSGGGSACGGAAPPRHWTEAEESESENHGDMGEKVLTVILFCRRRGMATATVLCVGKGASARRNLRMRFWELSSEKWREFHGC